MKEDTSRTIYFQLLNDDNFIEWLIHPTEESDRFWQNRMEQNAAEKEAIQALKQLLHTVRVEDKGLSPEAKHKLWESIDQSTAPREKSFFVRLYLMRGAAVLLLLLLPAFYYLFRKNIPEVEDDSFQSFTEQIISLDESENVRIILANREYIEVEDKEVAVIYDKEGNITINSKEQELKQTVAPTSQEWNQLIVPYGKMSSIVLADGSKIWVNSGSRVAYPTYFAEHKREIRVEGEVYLEVSKNEKCPFIVKTDLLEVEVLGTSFNLSAYKSDDNQSVVLTSGLVSVKPIRNEKATTIHPNQKFTFDKQNHTAQLEEVDVFHYIAWKYGFIYFQREKLAQVLKKVERYYNIPLKYDPEQIDPISVSGKLDLKDDIEETFKIISLTAVVACEIHDDYIEIHVKP